MRFDGTVFRYRDFRANDAAVTARLGPEIDAVNALVRRFRFQFEADGDDIPMTKPRRFLVEVVGRFADGAANYRPTARDDRAVRRKQRVEVRLRQRLVALALFDLHRARVLVFRNDLVPRAELDVRIRFRDVEWLRLCKECGCEHRDKTGTRKDARQHEVAFR